MREHILSEIKRLETAAGKPSGKQVFSRETGIRGHQWCGVFWAKLSDALKEAGFEKNELQGRYATDYVLAQTSTSPTPAPNSSPTPKPAF